MGAEGSVTVEILGVPYTWTGDLPYVPQIDFQVEAETAFDPWAWPPGVSAADATEPQTVAQIDLLGLAGFSIPGVEGGFQLDVALDLEVSYATDRIVVTTPDGVPVAGGDVVGADDTTLAAYAGGPFVELDVHPEGTVRYEGLLHLYPTLYVEVLGNQESTQLADVPIDLPPEERPFVFEARRVHVPLPDLQLDRDGIDFGSLGADADDALVTIPLDNDGEAAVTLSIATSDDAFTADADALEIDPGGSATLAVAFHPLDEGAYEATLTLASNDPDAPAQTLWLRGSRRAADTEPAPGPEPEPPPLIEDASCACRAAQSGPLGRPWPLLAGLGVLAALLRRRRTS